MMPSFQQSLMLFWGRKPYVEEKHIAFLQCTIRSLISQSPDTVSHDILHCLWVGLPLDAQVVRACTFFFFQEAIKRKSSLRNNSFYLQNTHGSFQENIPTVIWEIFSVKSFYQRDHIPPSDQLVENRRILCFAEWTLARWLGSQRMCHHRSHLKFYLESQTLNQMQNMAYLGNKIKYHII